MWHPSVRVDVFYKSLQVITCEVFLPSSTSPMVVSFLYASSEETDRKYLWNELISISNSQRLQGKPWAVLGDFNQVLRPEENSAATSPNIDLQTRLFADSLIQSGLVDLTFRGSSNTWWNKRRAQPIAKKLDRFLVNEEWFLLFPLSLAFFGEPAFSDHASLSVSLQSGAPRQKKPFRFFNFLLKNENFIPLLAQHWFSFQVLGFAMYRVVKKLKSLKPVIRDFSRQNYSDIEKRVAEAAEALAQAQVRTLNDPSTENAELELYLQEKWLKLSSAEESFFYQKSRVSWLQVGDRNTPYFHLMANARQAINHIHYLENAAGRRYESQSDIHDHCISYFSGLLGKSVEPPLFIQEDISGLFQFSCSDSQQDLLASPFSSEEIKAAFFSLPRNKASGPDGYCPEFFMRTWSVVGGEVTASVSEFFTSGSLLNQINATNLVLIPKIPNASKTSDFRPISCLNTIYKVISKLLADRLKEIIGLAVGHSQSAFILGHLLSENVLLATEIIHCYNKHGVEPSGMLKVDLRKAFDSIRWDFVVASLRAINVPERFVNWIHTCISSESFSISVNGHTGGYFRSTQGLRQGDPLSSYLFVLAMEVFSGLLRSRFNSGYIRYHPHTEEPDISHLMFADDVMIFFDGSGSSLHGINETLDDFAGWSGLHMNREKTQLFHAGLSPAEANELTAYGYSSGTLPIRYLGLPLMHRKLKVGEYSPLTDKLSSRFQAWATKSLSFAGRALLLKTVIMGLVIFWISTFSLPKSCINKIESLCSKFLWSGSIDSRANAKVSWKTLCLPKAEGGIGLRSFKRWNTTLLLRFVWLLFSGSASLWVAWHRLHNCQSSYHFWSQPEVQSQTWNWRCLLRLRDLASNFLISQIKDRQSTSFWFDNWTPAGPLISVFGQDGTRRLRIRIDACVAEACYDYGWRLPNPRSDEEVNLHAYLSTISLPSPELGSDSFAWNTDGEIRPSYSSAKTWEVL